MKLRGRLTNADFGFDPIGLLKGLCGVLLGCSRHDEGARTTLIGCLATHDDLEIPVLRKLLMIVTRDHMLPLPEQRRLAALVEAIAEEACRHGAAVGGAATARRGASARAGTAHADVAWHAVCTQQQVLLLLSDMHSSSSRRA